MSAFICLPCQQRYGLTAAVPGFTGRCELCLALREDPSDKQTVLTYDLDYSASIEDPARHLIHQLYERQANRSDRELTAFIREVFASTAPNS